MKQLQYILTSFLIICACHLSGQTNYNVGTTAVPFLRIATDARASGMASTGIATLPDGNATYFNIGKLPFNSKKGAVNANYSPWLKEWSNDMYLASLTAYYKISEDEAIHGLVKYFHPGALQFTDNNGNHIQSFHPYECSVDLGYSRKLSDRTGLGLSIKYIRSDLTNGTQNGESFKAGNAVAADIGFYYDMRKQNENGWSFGSQLSNLGSKISYTQSGDQKDFLPANLGFGASYSEVFNEQNKLIFALDINKLLVPVSPTDPVALASYRNKSVVGSWLSSFSDQSISRELKEFQLSIGAEYWYNDQFALRAGYFFEDKIIGNRKYFSAGASIRYNILTANFSYLIPVSNSQGKNPLANALIFGVSINLK